MSPIRFSLALTLGIVCLGGCSCEQKDGPPPKEVVVPSGPVRLLVVDDPALAEVIQREWSARTEGGLTITEQTAAEVVAETRLEVDAVIYPSWMLGEFAQRQQILPVPDDVLANEQLQQRDVFRLVRLHETRWGEETYAVSLGSPQLVLYYRSDLFQKLEEGPPTSWSEYQQLAELFSQRDKLGDAAPPDGANWHAVVEPLGPGWAGQVLLARAAAYARHRSQYSALFDYTSMKPMIDGPPFVRALTELVAAAEHGPDDAVQWTPHDARRQFLQGECAMALSWPTRAGVQRADETRQPRDDRRLDRVATGFAELPGSKDMYDFFAGTWEKRRDDEPAHVPLLASAGRLGSVVRGSGRTKAAFAALVWISGKEWSGQIAPYSPATTFYRTAHLSSPEKWVDAQTDLTAARQYAALSARLQTSPSALVSLRIPGRQRYMAALDEAVHDAVAGRKTPAAALTDAAARWTVITEELGTPQQRDAYRRSLGLAP